MNRYIRVYRNSGKNIKFDYITPHTSFVSGTTVYDQLEAVVPTEELTGSNTEQGRDSLNRVIAGIIRLAVSSDTTKDIQLYISDGFHQIELGKQSQNFNNEIGDIRWVYGTTSYLRINSLSTDRDIFIFEDTSSSIGILSSPIVPIAIDGVNNPEKVLISNDLKTILFKEKPLPYEDSLRWNLHSTAGMDIEYFKIERCNQANNAVRGTAGNDFISYKETTKDQTVNASNISTRYNKSKYGEAQVRVWGANSNQYVKVYYKNYSTEAVYDYEEAPITYDGVVTFNDNGLGCIFNDNGQDITLLEEYKRVRVRFNTYLSRENYVEYKTSDLIDYIEVIVDNKTYIIKENTPIYVDEDGVDCGYILPGIVINYIKKDLITDIKVFGVSNDVVINVVPIKLKISYKNNYLYNDKLDKKTLLTSNTIVEDSIVVETITNIVYPKTCKFIGDVADLKYSIDGENWSLVNDGDVFTTNGLVYFWFHEDPLISEGVADLTFSKSTGDYAELDFYSMYVLPCLNKEEISSIDLNKYQYKDVYIYIEFHPYS